MRADRFREFLPFALRHQFTNMSLLLFSAAVIVFLIGLISEQITNLTYRRDG